MFNRFEVDVCKLLECVVVELDFNFFIRDWVLMESLIFAFRLQVFDVVHKNSVWMAHDNVV